MAGESGTILVVEDEEMILENMGRYFEALGYRAILARDGIHAMYSLLNEGGIDVVLSDLTMPNASGLEFLDALRQNQFDIPFIFVTGFKTDEMADAAKALGALEVFEKPVRMESLASIVARGVEMSRAKIKLAST